MGPHTVSRYAADPLCTGKHWEKLVSTSSAKRAFMETRTTMVARSPFVFLRDTKTMSTLARQCKFSSLILISYLTGWLDTREALTLVQVNPSLLSFLLHLTSTSGGQDSFGVSAHLLYHRITHLTPVPRNKSKIKVLITFRINPCL